MSSKDALIVEWDLANVQWRLIASLTLLRIDGSYRPIDDRQRSQSEKIELDQSRAFDILHVELSDESRSPAPDRAARNQSAPTVQ